MMLSDAIKVSEPLEVRIEESQLCLAVTASGTYSFENLYKLLDLVRVETGKRGRSGALLDITRVAGSVPTLDMHELGLYLERMWNRATRLAIVSPKGGLSKFLECLMWTRGLDVGVLPDRSTATDWLADSQ